jgi:hypothetical protein
LFLVSLFLNELPERKFVADDVIWERNVRALSFQATLFEFLERRSEYQQKQRYFVSMKAIMKPEEAAHVQGRQCQMNRE